MANRKFDYDSKEFYDEIERLARAGLTDAEIAVGLEDAFGETLTPSVFCTMKSGTYSGWSEEENKKYGDRISKVLAYGRARIMSKVRGTYLVAALGGRKIKTTAVTRRKLRMDGVYTDDEEIQTTETEQELPPNIQALATWLYHHDKEWRKVQKGLDDEGNTKVDGININISYNKAEDLDLQEKPADNKNGK